MRRALPLIVLLALAAGGGWWVWQSRAADAAAGPLLRVAEADRGAITSVVAATGTVNPVLSVQVGSQLSGQIRELMADFNTRVTANQPIARLDTATIEARRAAAAADLLSAQAAVLVARAQAERAEAERGSATAAVTAAQANAVGMEALLRDAESEARRTAELRTSGVGSSRDALRTGFTAEGARSNLLRAQAQTAQAEAQVLGAAAAARVAQASVETAIATEAQKLAQLRQVEVDLNNATIRSPIDGIVVSRNVDLGQTVAATYQAPILFMIAANLDEMEVWATVDEADIGRVQAGQEATFSVSAFPNETIRGRVKEIRLAATTISNVVTYTVVVTVPNTRGRLLPGMTATLRIITDQRPNALRVPNAALRWRPAGAAAPGGAPAAPQTPIEQALADLPDLSAAQRQDIAAAQAEFRERIAALPSDADARRSMAQAARQRLTARLNGVLTPDQRAQLAASRGRAGQAGTVWVREDENAPPRAVQVRIGLSDGSVTEVTGGDLEPGAKVVVGSERATAATGTARRLF
ncbi:efflux RND transporter periplasmic adaptor subunit [Humitalea sp. 24SJ18S-53]|uniref:efflux RND transporter periplasmic adaptor subunit n=1 Tax=Humitalea sp. 24SJ18S-53 TaxID=3422307 RepID=UPI003D6695E5